MALVVCFNLDQTVQIRALISAKASYHEGRSNASEK